MDEGVVILERLQRENRELREEVNRLRKELEEEESKNKDLQEEINRQKEEIIPISLFVVKYIIKQDYCKHCDRVVYPKVPETIGNWQSPLRHSLPPLYRLPEICPATTMIPGSEWRG